MGTGNQLSYAVHVKPVRKHQLHHMVGVDDEGSRAFTGKGTYLELAHSQDPHTQSAQSPGGSVTAPS